MSMSSEEPALEPAPASGAQEGAGSFPVVGIGASAGGLEAFTQLLAALPLDTGMAFVLIQHLSPTHPSLLVQLLAKITHLRVVEAQNGMAVEPNRVYVIPPNQQLSISQGVLALSPRQKSGHFLPVNTFFNALAEDLGRLAIGVVLSGTDGDGTLGLRAIKAAGGLAFAQDEPSSQFASMPHNAAATGLVDFILPAAEIAAELARLGHHPYLGRPEQVAQLEGADGEKARLPVVALLQAATGVDFSQYKRPTFKRRLERRMALQRIEHPQEYVQYLEAHPQEIKALYQDVLICVTNFFRDPDSFEALQNIVLPSITAARSRSTPIRIWVAGCATGEEVYSLAIVILEFLAKRSSRTPVKLFGTDISEEALSQARSGLYHLSQLEGVSAERLQRFFVPTTDGVYQVSKQVRELCVFARHDLLGDPPFSQMDLVSCRNVLIYFVPVSQKRVLTTFHYSLKPDSYLMLGSSESLGGAADLFHRVETKSKLYTRKLVPARLPIEFIGGSTVLQTFPSRPIVEGDTGNDLDLQKEADRIVLGRYAPVGVVINSDGDVVHFRGQTGAYLSPAPGRASLSLLKMVHAGLRAEVRSAIQGAKKHGVAQSKEGIELHDGERVRWVRLDVAPFKPTSGETYFLVLFTDLPEGGASGGESPSPRSWRTGKQTDPQLQILTIRQELIAKEEYLRTAIEESEAINQNLRVANEEILSSNEELQSTNEELQTAKEEIQATNEELHTINEELQRRNQELDLLGNDLQNLLASTQIPIVMLDNVLRIRRFTPLAGSLLHLIPTDIGRPMHDINHQLSVDDLPGQILEVINSLETRVQEVQDREGRWHELRIRPYRTIDRKIEGAVLVLVDIDQSKQAAETLKASRDYAESIVETVREPLVVLDNNLQTVTANRAFYELFKTVARETEGKSFYALGKGQWDLPALRSALERIRVEGSSLHDFEIEQEFEHIGRRSMLLNARSMPLNGQSQRQILLAIADVTVQNRLEAERAGLLAASEEARREAEVANRAKDTFLATLSHELRNPLNPIIGFSQLLLRGKCDPAQTVRALETIERCGKLQAQLIEDMLDTSSMLSGKLKVDLRPINLVPVVRNALEVVNASAAAKSICIETNLSTSLPVLADPTRMQQVVWNLLVNAVKFTPVGGRVEVVLRETSSGIRLTVADTGIGISPEFMPRLFERFTQAVDSSRTRTRSGLGLGLYLVRTLTELHGGTVTAQSNAEGQGTLFTIDLPAAPTS